MDVAQNKIKEATDRLEGLIARMENSLVRVQGSREIEYRRLLQETVGVLVSTRSAFHSKQLKRLRERIEAALK